MQGEKTNKTTAAFLVYLFSVCIVVTIRLELTGLLTPWGQTARGVDPVIEQRKQVLAQCMAGSLPESMVENDFENMIDEEKLFAEMKIKKREFAAVPIEKGKHERPQLADSIKETVYRMKPKPVFLREEDISADYLKNYPFTKNQYPFMLLNYSKDDYMFVYTLIKQENEIKLIFLRIHGETHAMTIVDSFPAENITDEQGKYRLALYHIPPWTKDTYYQEPSGCGAPHYSDLEMLDAPEQVKLSINCKESFYYLKKNISDFSKNKSMHTKY